MVGSAGFHRRARVKGHTLPLLNSLTVMIVLIGLAPFAADDAHGNACSRICVSAVGPADGLSDAVEVTVCVPTGFTNKVDIFAFDSGRAPYAGTNSVWLAVATGLQPAGGTNVVVWTNRPLGDVEYQFYTAGSDEDEDGDGLSSAMEIMTYNASPTRIDSDADGYVDGYDGLVSTNAYAAGIDLDGDGYVDGEVGNGTAPDNDDVTPPAITIRTPQHGQVLWVIP